MYHYVLVLIRCCAKIHQAGIKIWVLTGDKVETAINIGRSCRLLTTSMVRDKTMIVINIDESLGDEPAKKLTIELLDKCWDLFGDSSPEQCEHQALVISGKALGFVFPIRKIDKKGNEILPPQAQLDSEKILQGKLLRICHKSKAVVCCQITHQDSRFRYCTCLAAN